MLAVAVTAGGVTAAATLGFLVLLARAVDRVFREGATVSDVAGLLAAMVAALVVRAALSWLAEVQAQRASGRLRATVRDRMVQRLLVSGPTGLQAERSGELTSTVGDGVDALDPYVTSFLPAAALAAAVPALVFVVIGVLDPPSTLVLMFSGPILILLLAVIGRRTLALTERRFDEMGWLGTFFLDMVRGLGTLKAFNRSDEGADRIEEASRRHGETTMEILRTAFQTSLVMEWAATAATALVAVEVSLRLVNGSLGFGTALGVLVLTPEFFVPLRRLALEYHAGQTGGAAWARISELLADPSTGPVEQRVRHHTGSAPRNGGAGGGGASEVPVGDVRLRDVVVTHPGASGPALRGVDLDLHRGETVALVGASGAGKTTVATLLLAFTTPDSGSVTVGGVPLGGIDPRAWRRSVAWVPQDPTVFAGTVADNIRLGAPDATDAQVRDAARSARADTFIDALPHGYDTTLGEGGLRLSGGQRQRLAIARALVRDCPYVVLDEFTAHLDPETEADVVDAVGTLLQDRTALVIAHRLLTARVADRIAVMDAGRIVEVGTHDDLLAHGERYPRLVAEYRGGPDRHEPSA